MQPPLASDPNPNDIKMTPLETKRLEECFKDPEFRDLLVDYVKEISNPSTKLQYEEYLKQVEAEGGAPNNRQLMTPEPVFCLRAKVKPKSVGDKPDKTHIFINFCVGALVPDAELGNSSGMDHPIRSSGSRKAGLHWQIPYILSQRRFDHKDGSLMYDIAFSKQTIHFLHQHAPFKKTVIQTALEAVNGLEREYSVYTDVSGQEWGTKWNILAEIKYKGELTPPLMSVVMDKPTRFVDPNVDAMHKKKTRSKHKSSNPPKKEKLGKFTKSNKAKNQKMGGNQRKKTIVKSKASSKEKSTKSSTESTPKEMERDEDEAILEEIKYRVVESGNMEIGECWNDHHLLIEPLKRPKQIHITMTLDKVDSIKDIDCQIDTETKSTQKPNEETHIVTIRVPSKYKECRIVLKEYDVIASSMKASWFTAKHELKLTFNIAPLRKDQIEKLKAKYSNLRKSRSRSDGPKENEIKLPNQQNQGFMLKEVTTKCVLKESESMDDSKDDVVMDDDLKIPQCHHKLTMRETTRNGKTFWICPKPRAADRCTAFKWKGGGTQRNTKRVIEDFKVEQRDKFDKTVFLIRITNILENSVNVRFGENGEIEVEFETHRNRYKKVLKVKGQEIDAEESRFDVNCRNLLIMAVQKKEDSRGESEDSVMQCVDDILNDSMLSNLE